MEICSEYGFRAIYDRSPLRVHHNVPSIPIRDEAFIVLLDHPFSHSFPASISDRCALDKRKNLPILFLACVTRAKGRKRGVCKYTYRKEGKRRIWNKAVFAIPRKGIRENISFFFFPYSRFVRIIRQYESIILPIRFLLCIVIYWSYETTQKRVDKVSFVQCLLFIGT